MQLEPGRELLHYRLAEKIGEGGMGVVWRALDTTLNREVAIKVLPDGFAGDADRLARFEREAKLLASLNHPHIAGIYGIHNDEGLVFLAMELVDGEDLAQRLSRGALHRDEALKIGLQIAQAFEAAHESGVIHRDLKPANVKLTTAGNVKVLDFGLAKALSTDPSEPGISASMSPTMTSTGTLAGALIGTASYMSPEQAKGKPADRRADIWSYGVLLHEMLTGRRMFEGETISETLAAVIMKDIELGSLPGDTPKPVRRLLKRCLERDPNTRLRDIGDARIAIEEAMRDSGQKDDAAVEPVAAPRSKLAWLPWAIAGLALVGMGWFAIRGGSKSDSSPVMRLSIDLNESQGVGSSPLPVVAISPDGTRIAYTGTQDGDSIVYLRMANQKEPVPLRGTTGADSPFFSPDGEWIGFFADRSLKKVSILGGPATTLCRTDHMRGASWGDDDMIVFAPRRSGTLHRVSAAGGEPELLIGEQDDGPDQYGAQSDRWPQVLPGSEWAIFTSTSNNSQYQDAEIRAISLVDGTVKTLIRGGAFGRYVAPGFLVYGREGTLFAIRFDPKKVETIGNAVPVIEGVSGVNTYGSLHLSVSQNGTLVYLDGNVATYEEELVWLSLDGTLERASRHVVDYGAVRLSPDESMIALEVTNSEDGVPDIWVLERERDQMTRLTFSETIDVDPLWTPDGQYLVYASIGVDAPAFNIYRIRADGTGEPERLTNARTRHTPISWTPDGSELIFMNYAEASVDLMRYRPGQDPEIIPFATSEFGEFGGFVSPDGRWVLYQSDISGKGETYARPLNGDGQAIKISTDGSAGGRWAKDNRSILYRNPQGKLLSVAISTDGDRLRVELPVERADFPMASYSFLWDTAKDGRVLAYRDLTLIEDRRIPLVVVNWSRELEETVPQPK